MADKDFIAQMGQSSEVKMKVEFYENVVEALSNKVLGIQQHLKNNGAIREVALVFGIFPIVVKRFSTKFEIADLNLQLHHLKQEIFVKERAYKTWKQRADSYAVEFEKKIIECDEHFDLMEEHLGELSVGNPQITAFMNKYTNPNNDAHLRLEFYLWMKNRLEKYCEEKRFKFSLENYSNKKEIKDFGSRKA